MNVTVYLLIFIAAHSVLSLSSVHSSEKHDNIKHEKKKQKTGDFKREIFPKEYSPYFHILAGITPPK